MVIAKRVPLADKFALYWDCPNKKCPELHMITQTKLAIVGEEYVCPKCSTTYKVIVVLAEARNSVKFTIEVRT